MFSSVGLYVFVPYLNGTGLGLESIEQCIDEPGLQSRQVLGVHWRAGQWAGDEADADVKFEWGERLGVEVCALSGLENGLVNRLKFCGAMSDDLLHVLI